MSVAPHGVRGHVAMPLFGAAKGAHAGVATILIKAGHSVNTTTPDGHQAIHQAASASATAFLKVLIASNAELDRPSPTGDTPLHMAVGRRDHAVVRLLANCGANVDAKDAAGLTPFALSVDQRATHCAHALVASMVDSEHDMGAHIAEVC